MSQRTFCDVCGDEIEAVTVNAARAGGQVSGEVVRNGRRVTYELHLRIDPEPNPAIQGPAYDCCQPCAINALLVGEGYMKACPAPSDHAGVLASG